MTTRATTNSTNNTFRTHNDGACVHVTRHTCRPPRSSQCVTWRSQGSRGTTASVPKCTCTTWCIECGDQRRAAVTRWSVRRPSAHLVPRSMARPTSAATRNRPTATGCTHAHHAPHPSPPPTNVKEPARARLKLPWGPVQLQPLFFFATTAPVHAPTTPCKPPCRARHPTHRPRHLSTAPSRPIRHHTHNHTQTQAGGKRHAQKAPAAAGEDGERRDGMRDRRRTCAWTPVRQQPVHSTHSQPPSEHSAVDTFKHTHKTEQRSSGG